MFDPNLPHSVFPNVQVLKKGTSKKSGKPYVLLGWMAPGIGTGEKMIFDEAVCNNVTEGAVVNLRANISGDFLDNVELVGAGEAPVSTSTRSRRASAAA